MKALFPCLASLILLTGCQTAPRSARPVADAPLFDGLGDHTRVITTSSTAAQRYFNQGLNWTFSFNHDEAIRSFKAAAALDPNCAMAWWGVALCNGPHINNPFVDEAHAAAAWVALEKAQALKDGASPVEQALIDALAARYANPQPANRRPLDEAYAAAMQRVWRQYPQDNDVATLYAEALMDLQPWDLWTPDDQPKGRTPEVLAVLEGVLKSDPTHPGACHLYIHACEAGPTPEKAVAAADQLRTSMPSSGHMTHMPSHIDVRIGQWEQAALQNQRAIRSDESYRKKSPNQGFYRLYMAHDHHFLAFADMMRGCSREALVAVRDMIDRIPPEFVQENGQIVDLFMVAPLDVMIRFGQWDDILAEPAPPAHLPFSTAFHHFARGVAYAAKKDVASATREQGLFRAKLRTIPEDQLLAINPIRQVLAVADHMLAGEIHLGANDYAAAIVALRAAAVEEDKLLYVEPPEWMHPVRQPLGAALLAAGRHAEAEAVYREDLKNWPENGWSLHGLAKALRAQNKSADAELVQARFDRVWQNADIKIDSSCLCVPNVAAAFDADGAATGVAHADDKCCAVAASGQ